MSNPNGNAMGSCIPIKQSLQNRVTMAQDTHWNKIRHLICCWKIRNDNYIECTKISGVRRYTRRTALPVCLE